MKGMGGGKEEVKLIPLFLRKNYSQKAQSY